MSEGGDDTHIEATVDAGPAETAGPLGILRNRAGLAELYSAVHDRHEGTRATLRRIGEHKLNQLRVGPAVRLTAITPVACAEVALWKDRLVDWPWADMGRRYRHSPARFEVALWADAQLCGLAIGKLSCRREVVRVDFVEGKRDNAQPLKGRIIPFVTDLAMAFAVAYFASAVRFMRPLEGAKLRYQKLGLDYVPKTKHHPDYYERKLP